MFQWDVIMNEIGSSIGTMVFNMNVLKNDLQFFLSFSFVIEGIINYLITRVKVS